MSVKIMSMVFDRYPEGGGEMLLALALADHAHDDGQSVHPSIAVLAEKTRQSERSVQYQLRRMEESGWLILVNSGNGGRNQRREYRISPDWVKGAEIAPLQRVQSTTVKGAIYDSKGCNPRQERVQPVAPAYNHQEPSIEPSVNHKGAQAPAKKSKFNPITFQHAPIADELWESFCEHRAQIRKPMTEQAAKQIVAAYAATEAAGMDAAACVKLSIASGWQGVFFDKANPAGGALQSNRNAPLHQRRADTIAALTGMATVTNNQNGGQHERTINGECRTVG